MTGVNPYTSKPPSAFKQHASGLYVPEDQARAREVWTRDEMRAIDKVTALLKARGLTFQFRCDDPACDDPTLVRSVDNGGNPVLTCGHKTRVFMRAL